MYASRGLDRLMAASDTCSCIDPPVVKEIRSFHSPLLRAELRTILNELNRVLQRG